MFNKLKQFRQYCVGKSSSHYLERLKFFKREGNRATCLKNLETWNARLGRLIQIANRKATRRALDKSLQTPSIKLRTLSRRLFDALNSCFPCTCQGTHELRFCIASCGGPKSNPARCGLIFGFLISHQAGQTLQKWEEGEVIIQSSR